MADSDTQRIVTLTRTSPGRFVATNVRGAQLEFGSGDDGIFSPVELLLAAIGGCTGMDVDAITGRRAQPESFGVEVRANKVRDTEGNHLTDIEVTFRVRFPDGEAGDAARTVMPEAVRKSRDRLCTVSRTVELPTPVASLIL
jgi:uncharacterized OsmC-like protein